MATEDTASLNNEEEAQPKKKKKHSIVFRIVSVIVLRSFLLLAPDSCQQSHSILPRDCPL